MLFLVIVTVWSVLNVRHRMVDSLDSSSTRGIPAIATEPPVVAAPKQVAVAIDDDAVVAKRPIDRELDAANWRNPFELKWWHAPGWSADAAGLHGTGRARFRKPFVGVSLSAVVDGAGDSIVPLPSIRLENVDEPGSSVIVRWDRSVVSVSRARRGYAPRIVREADLPSAVIERNPPHRRHLQLVATGNRLVIAEDRKRLIFCDQPSEISGRRFYVSIDAGDQVLSVRDLRMDGE